jgi:8-oxo-dGTP pyrophosphatase MutT (NUDIX family)
MVIFVNNIPVHILDQPEGFAFTEWKLDFEKLEELKGKPLIYGIKYKRILLLIDYLTSKALDGLEEIAFVVKDVSDFKQYIKNHVSFVKAAGGVVKNHEGKILMMKRLGFWDLPKGKAEKGEKSEITALREVEEECNVTVFSDGRLVTSWHTYIAKGRLHLKRTKWYKMGLVSDSKMKPQKEEGIEELVWMTDPEVVEAEKRSYKSISFVLEAYRKNLSE